MVIVGLMSRHNTKTVCVVTVHCTQTMARCRIFGAVFVAHMNMLDFNVEEDRNSPIGGALLTAPVAEYYFFS